MGTWDKSLTEIRQPTAPIFSIYPIICNFYCGQWLSGYRNQITHFPNDPLHEKVSPNKGAYHQHVPYNFFTHVKTFYWVCEGMSEKCKPSCGNENVLMYMQSLSVNLPMLWQRRCRLQSMVRWLIVCTWSNFSYSVLSFHSSLVFFLCLFFPLFVL